MVSPLLGKVAAYLPGEFKTQVAVKLLAEREREIKAFKTGRILVGGCCGKKCEKAGNLLGSNAFRREKIRRKPRNKRKVR